MLFVRYPFTLEYLSAASLCCIEESFPSLEFQSVGVLENFT